MKVLDPNLHKFLTLLKLIFD